MDIDMSTAKARAIAAAQTYAGNSILGHGSSANIGYDNRAEADMSELGAILSCLRATYDHVSGIEAQISTAVARLRGGGSEACEAPKAVPARYGLVGEMDDALDRIGATLDRISADCATLNRIV